MGLQFMIEIDGGVTVENVGSVAQAGCDWIVAGSSIFHTADPGSAYREMKKAAIDAVTMRV